MDDELPIVKFDNDKNSEDKEETAIYCRRECATLPFNPVKKEDIVKGNLKTGGEKRLWVFGGLNVKGICKAQNCSATGKSVFVNWGYGSFDLAEM